MMISHLRTGPTALFKVTTIKVASKLSKHGHTPALCRGRKRDSVDATLLALLGFSCRRCLIVESQ